MLLINRPNDQKPKHRVSPERTCPTESSEPMRTGATSEANTIVPIFKRMSAMWLSCESENISTYSILAHGLEVSRERGNRTRQQAEHWTARKSLISHVPGMSRE